MGTRCRVGKTIEIFGCKGRLILYTIPYYFIENINNMINLAKEIKADYIIFTPMERKGRVRNIHVDWSYYEEVTNFLKTKSMEEETVYSPSWEVKKACLFISGMISIRPNGFLKPCLQPDQVFSFWNERLITSNNIFELKNKDLEKTSIYKMLLDSDYPSSFSILPRM